MADFIPTYEEVTSEETLREFMDAEIKNMGSNLLGFEISWCLSEGTVDLTLASQGKPLTLEESRAGFKGQDPRKRFGQGVTVGYIQDLDHVHIDVIQKKGRELYYRLRKDYPNIHRNLGKE